MCKKTVKWYLKDTNKEVCLGDNVTYFQSIKIDKYPGLTFESAITHPMDEEDAQILVDSDILVAKEEKPVEDYTNYLKWLADKEGFKYSDVFSSFSLTCKINPNAALSILLKAISRKLNKNITVTPRKVWIINISEKKPALVDVTNDNYLKNIAWFLTKNDADYALEVCKPILEK